MTEFTQKDADYIREWNSRLPRSVSIRLLKSADHRTGQFEEFGRELALLAPKVALIPQEGEADQFPAFLLEEAWRYHLIPEGAEFKPFFELIATIARGQADLPEALSGSVQAVRWPSFLKIYVTNFCPHCREMVTRLVPLPVVNPLIHIDIIDGMLFPELSREDKIRAVPTVICDERFRFTGPLAIEELAEVMIRRDPAELGIEIVKRMIREGATGPLADMILEADLIFPAFREALLHPEWPLRLGAMVVFEDIVERRPALAAAALEPIWRDIQPADDNVKGDMIYLIGTAGDRGWIPRLERFRSANFSKELSGVIEEAIDSLQNKTMRGTFPG